MLHIWFITVIAAYICDFKWLQNAKAVFFFSFFCCCCLLFEQCVKGCVCAWAYGIFAYKPSLEHRLFTLFFSLKETENLLVFFLLLFLRWFVLLFKFLLCHAGSSKVIAVSGCRCCKIPQEFSWVVCFNYNYRMFCKNKYLFKHFGVQEEEFSSNLLLTFRTSFVFLLFHLNQYYFVYIHGKSILLLFCIFY